MPPQNFISTANVDTEPVTNRGQEEQVDIQLFVEQLYEDMGLTDNLTDEPAKILLQWAEGELTDLYTDNEAQVKSTARQLRRVVTSINRLAGQHQELDDTKLIQRLVKLVEQSMQLAAQKSIAQI